MDRDRLGLTNIYAVYRRDIVNPVTSAVIIYPLCIRISYHDLIDISGQCAGALIMQIFNDVTRNFSDNN